MIGTQITSKQYFKFNTPISEDGTYLIMRKFCNSDSFRCCFYICLLSYWHCERKWDEKD